jgi:hypothetical protein
VDPTVIHPGSTGANRCHDLPVSGSKSSSPGPCYMALTGAATAPLLGGGSVAGNGGFKAGEWGLKAGEKGLGLKVKGEEWVLGRGSRLEA